VLAFRLERQHLARRAGPRDLLGVVGDLAGVHAQLMGSAELTLHARIDGLPRDAVTRALWEERTLVKTWALRGTLHLLPAAELGLWAAAQRVLTPRHHAPAWQRYHGVGRDQVDAALTAIPEVLAEGPLTRGALADAVAARAGDDGLRDALTSGWGAVLKLAALRGELVFAPDEGRNVRFVAPGAWLGEVEEAETDDAAREVVRRFLRAYGPASREAVARWFGAPSPAVAGRMVALLGDDVVPVAVEDEPGWLLAADVEAVEAAEPTATVRLLPAFDQYVVCAPRDAEAVLAAEHRGAVYRPQGWLSPVVVAGGRILGTWEHEAAADGLVVRIAPFAPLGPAERGGVEDEARRLAVAVGEPLARVEP
jgi:uncharacterized protein YcaQ